MSGLKTLRIRINSVKSTQKITKAMKMVAASKLRKAEERAEAARPYAERMDAMLKEVANSMAGRGEGPKTLVGTGSDKTHLLVVTTSDRGLCGAFNAGIVRATKGRIGALQEDGKTVKLFCLGRKSLDALGRDHEELIIDRETELDKGGFGFPRALDIAQRITNFFEEGAFDVCSILYNHFKSVISQEVRVHQLVPFAAPSEPETEGSKPAAEAIYEFEPDEAEILDELVPRNLAVQIYHSLLESLASEQAARMTAMDNATRNAGEMIDDLTLLYNRTRQAAITKELIEIVSGAEAL